MAKNKKKRTKRYTGADAAQGPVVHHYEAVERSRFGQWWVEHKTRARILGVIVLVVVVLILVISGIASLIH